MRHATKRLSLPEKEGTQVPNIKNYRDLKEVKNIRERYNINPKKLGEGAFGSVHKATTIPLKQEVAIKIIEKEKVMKNQTMRQLMFSEIFVLKKCSHPNLMNV